MTVPAAPGKCGGKGAGSSRGSFRMVGLSWGPWTGFPRGGVVRAASGER